MAYMAVFYHPNRIPLRCSGVERERLVTNHDSNIEDTSRRDPLIHLAGGMGGLDGYIEGHGSRWPGAARELDDAADQAELGQRRRPTGARVRTRRWSDKVRSIRARSNSAQDGDQR